MENLFIGCSRRDVAMLVLVKGLWSLFGVGWTSGRDGVEWVGLGVEMEL